MKPSGVFLTRKMHKPVSPSDMINSTIKKFFCFSVIMIPPYAVISLNIWLNIAFAKFGGTVLSNAKITTNSIKQKPRPIKK